MFVSDGSFFSKIDWWGSGRGINHRRLVTARIRHTSHCYFLCQHLILKNCLVSRRVLQESSGCPTYNMSPALAVAGFYGILFSSLVQSQRSSDGLIMQGCSQKTTPLFCPAHCKQLCIAAHQTEPGASLIGEREMM